MANVTEREIKDQYKAWRGVLQDKSVPDIAKATLSQTGDGKELVFIGCGTSYYLALAGAATYVGITGEPARAVTASDTFLYSDAIFPKDKRFLGIPISRSGETTETIWAAKHIANHMQIDSLALSCTPQSELVKVCDKNLVAVQAAEKSVVMTRSFTSMLLIIQKVQVNCCCSELHIFVI